MEKPFCGLPLQNNTDKAVLFLTSRLVNWFSEQFKYINLVLS